LYERIQKCIEQIVVQLSNWDVGKLSNKAKAGYTIGIVTI